MVSENRNSKLNEMSFAQYLNFKKRLTNLNVFIYHYVYIVIGYRIEQSIQKMERSIKKTRGRKHESATFCNKTQCRIQICQGGSTPLVADGNEEIENGGQNYSYSYRVRQNIVLVFIIISIL